MVLGPGASRFRPMAHEEIRAEAEARCRLQQDRLDKDMGGKATTAGCAVLGAFVSLLVPVIGPLLFIGLLVAAAVEYFRDSSKQPLNEAVVRNVAASLSNTVVGDCPSCNGSITIGLPPGANETHVFCPLCRASLHYSSGVVRISA